MTKEGDKSRGKTPLVPKSAIKLAEGKRPIPPKAADKGSDSDTKSGQPKA